ncbi:MAG: type I glyceraldehyde-3-phosphate dehydrogenase, partial [Candidatus Bathyarchaeia archaeon]
KTTAEEINAAFKAVANGPLKGIMDYTEEPLVSIDFNHNHYSAVIDAQSTMVIDGDLAKVLAWYDNEWGFSCRMVELIELVGKKAGL